MIGPSALPQDLAAEQAVLGSMLLDRYAIARAAEALRPEDFCRDDHRVIFSAILDLFKRGEPVDLITLSNRLDSMGKMEDVGDWTYVASLPNIVATAANVEYHVRIVRGIADRRALMDVGQHLIARARDGADVAGITDEAGRMLVSISARNTWDGTGVVFTTASTVEPIRVSWAWADHVAFGTVTLIAGEPGLGKSTLVLDRCARWTRGQLPGDAYGVPLPVVIASAEDHRAAVIVPRLTAAGADCERVYFVDFHAAEGLLRGLVLPNDLNALEARLRESGARVLVVDPLVAHLPGTVNSWRDQDVRRALAPLASMAERLEVAVVCIVHLNKAATADVLMRVSGSVGIVAAARAMFLVARDPNDDGQTTCLLAHAKSNLSALAPALRFRVEPCDIQGPEGPVPTSRITWLGEVEGLRATDLLTQETSEERGALRDAEGFLREALATGARPAEEVRSEARAAGMSEITLRRARTRLGVRSKREGFGRGGQWLWFLPDPVLENDPSIDDQPPPIDAQSENDDQLCADP